MRGVTRAGTLIFLVLMLTVGLVIVGCSGGRQAADSAAFTVFVSIPPQKFFAERIGGERFSVRVMVPPGKNPATYEPTPRQMVELAEADLFFTIGVPFEEAFLNEIGSSVPDLRLVATDEGIEKRRIEEEPEADEDGHDHGDHHHEEGRDPHIWMDPLLAKRQAAIMRDTLIELDPAGSDQYRAGFDSLAVELDRLHAELEEILKPKAGSTLFVYHPAFGYFADRYGLVQQAIETGGKEPQAAQLEAVIEKAQDQGVRVIFVQPEFPEKSAAAVAAAIGGTVVPAAPLREDYPANLRELAAAVRDGGAP